MTQRSRVLGFNCDHTTYTVGIPVYGNLDGHAQVYFTATLQQSRGEFRLVPCESCGRGFPAYEYIRPNGSDWEITKFVCCGCEPRPPWRFKRLSNGRVQAPRIMARLDNGKSLSTLQYDPNAHHWRSIENIGIRRMTPTGDVFRFQPRKDRAHDAAGVKYGAKLPAAMFVTDGQPLSMKKR